MFITAHRAQSIVDEMHTSIHHDLNIMDSSGVILASTNLARRGQLHHGAMEVIRNRLPSLTIWVDDAQAGVQRGINLPITVQGETVGVIGITGDPAVVSVFGEMLKRMTEIMLDSARQQEQSDLLHTAKSLFVENWLFADGLDWAELELRGRLLGLDINQPYTVALLELSQPAQGGYTKAEDLSEMRSGLVLRMAQNHIPKGSGSYCAVIRSRMIVLLCHSTRSATFSIIQAMCQDIEGFYAVRITGGISDACRSPQDIRRCYLAARTASQAALQSAKGEVVFYDEVSLEFIVQSIPASIKMDLSRLIFSPYPLREQEEMRQTVRLFFELDGDVKRCAQQLYLHRNTFQYRMDQLWKKTGYHLRVPKQALLLYLAAQPL